MKCENFLFLLDAYLEDELEPPENLQVAEHLAVCESCALSYKKSRREQEIFERYFLEAEATPDLWKNLQSAIRNEKIARPVFSSTSGAGRFEKICRDIFLGFPPRKTALAGLAVLVLCAIIFLFTRGENSSVEHAERDGLNPPVSQFDEQTERSSPDGRIKQKEDAPINRTTPVPKTAARPLPVTQIRRSSEKVKVLPLRNPETALKQTKLKNDLLPGEQKYLETIARLTVKVKSVETQMPPALSVEYKRNLSTVDQAIIETRRAAQLNPKNSDLTNFVASAYRSKITLLSEIAKQSKSSTPRF
jgi:hypothetical protein